MLSKKKKKNSISSFVFISHVHPPSDPAQATQSSVSSICKLQLKSISTRLPIRRRTQTFLYVVFGTLAPISVLGAAVFQPHPILKFKFGEF
jgi:hypothetical protein